MMIYCILETLGRTLSTGPWQFSGLYSDHLGTWAYRGCIRVIHGSYKVVRLGLPPIRASSESRLITGCRCWFPSWTAGWFFSGRNAWIGHRVFSTGLWI